MHKLAVNHGGDWPAFVQWTSGWMVRLKSNPLPYLAAYGVAAVMLLVGIGWLTAEKTGTQPYLHVLGGGFIFNYRVSDIFYGVAVVPVHSVEVGDVVEARFEDPAGGPDIPVRKQFGLTHEPIQLRTPPLQGVIAGRPYRVELRVLSRVDERVMWSSVLHYRSNIDGKLISPVPPVLGPGYHRNPAYPDKPLSTSPHE
ncbi:hypothetical protein [Sedimenticola sp.]|uniref:hypothetical protein n=1 Tax=Sedimenticola sp. TaxID=1940285 RepID=UPI003D09D9AB